MVVSQREYRLFVICGNDNLACHIPFLVMWIVRTPSTHQNSILHEKTAFLSCATSGETTKEKNLCKVKSSCWAAIRLSRVTCNFKLFELDRTDFSSEWSSTINPSFTNVVDTTFSIKVENKSSASANLRAWARVIAQTEKLQGTLLIIHRMPKNQVYHKSLTKA